MLLCEASAVSDMLQRVLEQTGDLPAEGYALLNDVRDFIGRFCVFPDARCLDAVTLWAAHTHMVEHFHTTPRLALLSPDPGSGKTRVLEVLDLLVAESMLSISASPAAIFRTLSETQITLLFDEVDAIWNKRGRDDNHEDLRSLLNAGYKRGATIPRCVGPKHEVQHFNVFCAVALAGLGELPDTIMSRSIIIKMQRRAHNEKIEPFRIRRHQIPGQALRERLANWAVAVGEAAGSDWPEIPNGVVDRNEEIWEPLLAIADQAGGNWPEAARKACIALCKAAEDRNVSLGIRLLGDLRLLFGASDALSTATLLDLLVSGHSGLDEDAPWAELHGKPINARKLAGLLKPYGIKSTKVKIDGIAYQGYRREDLWSSWGRYLPPLPEEAEPVEPVERVSNSNGSRVPHGSNNPEPSSPKTERKLGQSQHLYGAVPQVP